jgi:hypothetical protein
MGAGFGNQADAFVHGQPPDGTEVLCKATQAFEMGDWVEVVGLAVGYLTIQTPSDNGTKKWCGVVQHKVASGSFCKVKTCGVTLAKVNDNTTPTTGDILSLRNGQVKAYQQDETGAGANYPCGRFLKALTGDDLLSWVHIDASDGAIAIHHHTDESNTAWVDHTDSTPYTGRSWHLFKVNQDAYTGGVDRLMLAIGGGSTHGESSKEGYGWGGVIGSNSALGFGQIGGNESAGKQGIVGAERQVSDTVYRLNIRSFAGINPNDRYGGLAYPNGIGPIRYTHPNNAPTWRAHSDCDATPPACPTGILWWGGSMMFDTGLPPTNGTSWPGQWVPGMTVERNCCDVQGAFTPETRSSCDLVSNPGQFSANANDLLGAYENIIPYGYTPTTGRLDELAAICCLVKHIRGIWGFLDAFTAVVGAALACVDATFATKVNGVGAAGTCCVSAGDATVQAIDCGPPSSTPCS